MDTNFMLDQTLTSTEIENILSYQKQFISYCEDNFPGAVLVNSSVYIQCRVASTAFAHCMVETNNVEEAYQLGLDILFMSYNIN